jgi:hypothetical protein
MASLFPFFRPATIPGVTIQNSQILFPVILFPMVETFHLFALTIMLGTTNIVGLRLLAVTFCGQPLPKPVSNLRQWNTGSLAVRLSALPLGSFKMLRQRLVPGQDGIPVSASPVFGSQFIAS